jgi:hypothetical protein
MREFFIKLILVAKLNGVKKSAVFTFLTLVFMAVNIFLRADLNIYFRRFNAIIINPALIIAMVYYWNKEKRSIRLRWLTTRNQLPVFFLLITALSMLLYEVSGRLSLVYRTVAVDIFIFSSVLGIASWLWMNKWLWAKRQGN